MSGFEWALVALGAAGAVGALVALDAAVIRRRRRRRNGLVQPPGRNQPQLRERRIEIVEIDEGAERSPEQEPNAWPETVDFREQHKGDDTSA